MQVGVAFVAGAVAALVVQGLLVGGLLATQSYDPILLNPDKELSTDGVSMAMICGEGRTPEGRGSEVLANMPAGGDQGAWSRGRGVRGDCVVWYHHGPGYNAHAHEACLKGCDHDWLERRLR